jgi:hypothetical protein
MGTDGIESSCRMSQIRDYPRNPWFNQAFRSISTIHPLRILCLHINLPEFPLSLEYEDDESDKERPEKEWDSDGPPGGANEDDRRIHCDDE